MITLTGESIWPRGSEHGDEGIPSLYSIGAGLGRIARFAGQTYTFYTVLAHTFTVADLVTAKHRIYALLHDAPEAIVADVPSTWKTPQAKAHEDDLLERISRANGLQWPWPADAIADVKRADLLALAAEAHVLGHAEARKWWPEVDGYAAESTELRLPHVLGWLDAHQAGSQYSYAIDYALRQMDPVPA